MTGDGGEPVQVGTEQADEFAVHNLDDLSDFVEVESDDEELAGSSAKPAETVKPVLSPSWLRSTQRTQRILENIARPKVLRDNERTRKWMENSVRPVRPEWLDRAESLSKLAQGADLSSSFGPKSQTMKILGALGSPRSSVLKDFAASEGIRKSVLGGASAVGDIVAKSTAERASFSVASGLKVSDSVTLMVSKLMTDTGGVGLSARSDLIASLGSRATGGLTESAKRLGLTVAGPSAASLGLRVFGPSAADLGLTARSGLGKTLARIMGDGAQADLGGVRAALDSSDSRRRIAEGMFGADIGRTRSMAMRQLVATSGIADLIASEKMMASWRQSLLSEATARSLVGTMALSDSRAGLLRDIVGANAATARVVGRYAELNKSLMFAPAVSARPTRELRSFLSGLSVAPGVDDLTFAVRASRGVAGLAAADLLASPGDVGLEAGHLMQEEVVEPWVSGPQRARTVLLDRLGALDGAIPELLQAAWDQVERNGPAAVSMAAHSVVETVDRTLRAVAPDDAVLRAHATGTLKKDAVYLRDGTHAPTRGGRIEFALLQRRPGETKLVAAQAKALASTVTLVHKELQAGKHASEGAVGLIRTYLVSVEYVLTQLLYEPGDD